MREGKGREQTASTLSLTGRGKNGVCPLLFRRKLRDVAEIVEVSAAYVSKKKKENDFPAEWAYKIGKKYNLSTDWILDGVERRRVGLLDEIDQWIKETGGKNTDWFENMFKAAFPMFDKWKRGKEESEDDILGDQSSKIA